MKLTTHVLDTARGTPGAGIAVTLRALDGAPRTVAQVTTNADGRTDAPLAVDLAPGSYELSFEVGAYFAGTVTAFYETIPIRFRIDDPSRDYHVPLLLAPWGYSTYRGS